jgi:hypothetical protein
MRDIVRAARTQPTTTRAMRQRCVRDHAKTMSLRDVPHFREAPSTVSPPGFLNHIY